MIDRESRTQLSELIRHLVAGRMTNDEFESRLSLHSADPAGCEVFLSGAWCLYSDLWEYGLTGKYRLPKQARREAARWILFLTTDLEYEWPRLGRCVAYFFYSAICFLSDLLVLRTGNIFGGLVTGMFGLFCAVQTTRWLSNSRPTSTVPSNPPLKTDAETLASRLAFFATA